jgi:hypothetical protein
MTESEMMILGKKTPSKPKPTGLQPIMPSFDLAATVRKIEKIAETNPEKLRQIANLFPEAAYRQASGRTKYAAGMASGLVDIEKEKANAIAVFNTALEYALSTQHIPEMVDEKARTAVAQEEAIREELNRLKEANRHTSEEFKIQEQLSAKALQAGMTVADYSAWQVRQAELNKQHELTTDLKTHEVSQELRLKEGLGTQENQKSKQEHLDYIEVLEKAKDLELKYATQADVGQIDIGKVLKELVSNPKLKPDSGAA